MAIYRFHCTNGEHAVFDGVGRRLANPNRLEAHAREVARYLVASTSEPQDWSDWIVTVHDLTGRQVLVLNVARAVAMNASTGPARSLRTGSTRAAGRRRIPELRASAA